MSKCRSERHIERTPEMQYEVRDEGNKSTTEYELNSNPREEAWRSSSPRLGDLLQTLCDLGDYLLFFRQTWGLRETFSTLDNVPRKLIDSEIAADNASIDVRAE